jgi:hypothetical protein
MSDFSKRVRGAGIRSFRPAFNVLAAFVDQLLQRSMRYTARLMGLRKSDSLRMRMERDARYAARKAAKKMRQRGY